MQTPDPLCALRWCWFVHGLCVLAIAGMLPVLAWQISDPNWGEAMTMLGAGRFVAPMQQLMPVIAAQALPCAIIGAGVGICVGWSWWGRCGWPLQVIAVAHLGLLPLATWWSHRLADQAGLLGPVDVVMEIVMLIAGFIALGWSMRVVARAHKALPITADSAP